MNEGNKTKAKIKERIKDMNQKQLMNRYNELSLIKQRAKLYSNKTMNPYGDKRTSEKINVKIVKYEFGLICQQLHK